MQLRSFVFFSVYPIMLSCCSCGFSSPSPCPNAYERPEYTYDPDINVDRLALGDKIRYRSFAEHSEIKLSYYVRIGYTQATLLNYPTGPYAGQRRDVRRCEKAVCVWKC